MTIPKLQLLCLANIKLQPSKSCTKLESYLPPVLQKISNCVSFIDFKNCWSDIKRLTLKLLLQKEFPATCAGGFAAFCLKDTKTFKDIDIFCYVDFEQNWSSIFLYNIIRDEAIKNVEKMIKRKIDECNIWAKVSNMEHPIYPDKYAVVIKIQFRRGKKIDFVCLFPKSIEIKHKSEQNALFRAENICKNFDLKMCQVAFIHLCAKKFLVYRLSENVPPVSKKSPLTLFFKEKSLHEFRDHFVEDGLGSIYSLVRMEKYFKRALRSYNRHTPECLFYVKHFVQNSFS